MSEGGGVTRFSETSGPRWVPALPSLPPAVTDGSSGGKNKKKKAPRRPSQSVISHNIKRRAGLTELFFQEERRDAEKQHSALQQPRSFQTECFVTSCPLKLLFLFLIPVQVFSPGVQFVLIMIASSINRGKITSKVL